MRNPAFVKSNAWIKARQETPAVRPTGIIKQTQPAKIKARIPCCEHRPAHANEVVLNVSPKQDRRCPYCMSWWRADVRQLSENMHAVEWTFVGKLSS